MKSSLPSGHLMELLANVLEYPEQETAEKRETLVALLDDWKPEAADALREHIEALADTSLYDQQERYAATFDVNPAVCMYVGYHVFGDSYPRGVFMSRLAGAYEKAGFHVDRELPDHVPAVLRYLTCPEAVDPVELVDDALVPALRKIVAAFAETTSPFAPLLAATLRTFERPDNAEVEVPGDAESEGRRTLALPVFSNKEDRALTPSPEAAAMIASRPRGGN